MLLIKLIHFFSGYVHFSATGGFPERFLNLCSRGGIVLWNLCCKNGVLYANTSVRGYKAIRPAARKSGMRVRIREKRGWPFFIRKHRRRAGLALGATVFFAVILFLSSRIWVIEVAGNDQITREEILEVLGELGLCVGGRKSALTVNELELLALEQMRELSWLNVNLKGSSVLVTVREKGPQPISDATRTPADILALKDGFLTVLEVYAGTAEKKVGDGVLRGEVLISGETVNKDESVTLRRASGYVVAQTEQSLVTEIPYEQTVRRIAQWENRYTLMLLGLRFPLGPQPLAREGLPRYTLQSWLEMNGLRMPLGLLKNSDTLLQEERIQYTPEQVRLLALEAHMTEYARRLRWARVTAQSLRAEETPEGYRVAGRYEALENIGICIEKQGSN